MYYEQLRDKLYADVPYPTATRALMHDIITWRKFCDLPADIKAKFAFPQHQGVWDDGYKKRRKAEGREDKEYFHFHGNYKTILDEYSLAEYVAKTPAIAEFWEFVDKIYEAVRELIVTIGNDLERHTPGIRAELDKSRDLVTLRFLHYTPEDPNETILAAPHFDRSGFTLHLYESAPGLQLMDWDGNWLNAPIGENSTVVFSGFQLEHKTSSAIQKTWHRVINTAPTEKRISLVAFVPFIDTYTYPEQARSQDLTPSYQPR